MARYLSWLGFPALLLGVARAETVSLTLVDGRVARGELVARSDDLTVWLRSEAPGVRLESGFAWEQVVAGQRGDQRMSVAKLRAEVANASPALLPPRESRVAAANRHGAQRVPPPQSPAVRRVVTLYIETRLASWDHDADVDGVEVRVEPRDARGECVPVRGQIELSLEGLSSGIPGRASGPFPPRPVSLERVSQMLTPDDFRPGYAVVRIPFTRFHPRRDLEIGPEALLLARCAVFGQGAFRARDAHVVLRPSSCAWDHPPCGPGEHYSAVELR